MGERIICLTNSTGIVGYPLRCKRKNLDPCLTPYIKINSRWIIDLHARAKTVKLLGEFIGEKNL